MILDDMAAAFETAGMNFVFEAWSHSPDLNYGVYSLSGQSALQADSDAGAEIMLEGYVDYFTRDTNLTAKENIESILRGLGIYWKLESIQFESDTGLIHYEWSWRDYGTD